MMIALAASALALPVLITPTAMAADGSLTAAQEAEFTTQASAVGMTPEAIDTALAKLEAGLLPDSYLAEARPIRTETRKDGYTITDVSYFEDGSINTLRYPDLEEMAAAVEPGDRPLPPERMPSGCEYFYTSVAISWTKLRDRGFERGCLVGISGRRKHGPWPLRDANKGL